MAATKDAIAFLERARTATGPRVARLALMRIANDHAVRAESMKSELQITSKHIEEYEKTIKDAEAEIVAEVARALQAGR